uniref:Uncharacterized protein n=1 Tax=Strongyloides stercoralis TaxID=6248 RepID=A0A0K0DZ01_STRER
MSFNENFVNFGVRKSTNVFENSTFLVSNSDITFASKPTNVINKNVELPTHPFKFFFYQQINSEVMEKGKELYLSSLKNNKEKE